MKKKNTNYSQMVNFKLECNCRFARLGATVVTWDINKVGNEETVKQIKAEGGRAHSFTVDMSSR